MSKQSLKLPQIISQFDAPMQRIAYTFIPNQKLAANIVKDVFEELYEAQQLMPGNNLYTILKNKVIAKCNACLNSPE